MKWFLLGEEQEVLCSVKVKTQEKQPECHEMNCKYYNADEKWCKKYKTLTYMFTPEHIMIRWPGCREPQRYLIKRRDYSRLLRDFVRMMEVMDTDGDKARLKMIKHKLQQMVIQ